MSNGLQQEDPLRLLLERDAVVSTVNRLFRATDERNWPGVESCFAPDVVSDMTYLAGGASESNTPEAISETWQKAVGHLEAVHHQAGNYEVRVKGHRAEASCYGIAFHYLPNDAGRSVRRIVGTYDIGLLKRHGSWCIDFLRYNVKFVDENLQLEGAEAHA